MDGINKQCPFCAEMVLQAALKCRYCGEFFDEQHDTQAVDTGREPARNSVTAQRNPGVAAALSFVIPGLGQIYNGEIASGLTIGGVCSVLYFAGVVSSPGFFAVSIPIHIALIYIAFDSDNGQKILDGLQKLFVKLFVVLFCIICAWLLVASFQSVITSERARVGEVEDRPASRLPKIQQNEVKEIAEQHRVNAKESPKKARQRGDLTSPELSRILSRTFEDKNGKTLDAYVVSVKGSSATLNSYGAVRKFEVKFFSKYNKEYLISGRWQLDQDAKIKAFLERERLMSK